MMEQAYHTFQSAMKQKKVLVLGAAIVDMIVGVERLPKSGEDVSAKVLETLVGGCAYNVSAALKHLEINHDLAAPIGKGKFADTIAKQLEKDGIPIVIRDESEDNGWCLSTVESGGERSFITIAGLETRWKQEWFDLLPIESYDIIYVNGYEIEASGELILQALERKNELCKLLFDPSPRAAFIPDDVLDKLLSMGTIVHCNKPELVALTKSEDPREGLLAIHEKTKEPVAVTLGKDGCAYYNGKELKHIPVKKVDIVDTIGAGDSHTAGFIAGITAGMSLRGCCALGNHMASLVVQQQGGKM
ncbi:PfkB family carbohydrate kinase [Bacillus massilinigeriensis]|uniref:PfkB family carbohydrate kinase n=1 Tax=Bacillus mediterraneensis TaxID=1805474 RepID=UPI000A703EA5|nr:PfkB family carbohydrate kinase [Bacillus mediterraneensis]